MHLKNKGGRPKGSGIQEHNILMKIAFYYIKMEKNGNINEFKFATAVKQLGLKPKIKIEEDSFIRRLRRKWNLQKDGILLQARSLESNSHRNDTLKNSAISKSYYGFNENLTRGLLKMHSPFPKIPQNYNNIFKTAEMMNELLEPHRKLMEAQRKIMQPLIDANKNFRKIFPKI